MEINIAKKSDSQEILSLQKLAYQSEAAIYNDYEIPPLTQSMESIESQFDDHTFLKVVVDGKIVGSVRAKNDGDTCYIGRLIVHPDFQNQRIGTKLMNEIEKLHEAHRYELFTGSKSERSLYLYKKLGYCEFRTEDQTDNVKIVFLQKCKKG